MTAAKPQVHVIGTGGSIAGIGPDRLDYMLYSEIGDHLTIQQSLDRVPEIASFASVTSEDLVSVGSTAIGATEWLASRRQNQQPPGRWQPTHRSGRSPTARPRWKKHPISCTSRSRPTSRWWSPARCARPRLSAPTQDLNLMDAVRIAASPHAGGMGVLTVLNNEIHSARDVSKANTFRVETFRPNELGFLGYADSDHQVVFYRAPLRKHTTATPFDVAGRDSLPRVEIVYSYAGADGAVLDAVRQLRPDGLVVVGFGGGTFPPAFLAAAARAVEDGIPVVLASRSTAGRVVNTPRKEEQGFIVCDNLLPQKARVLLMLALTVSDEREWLQQAFLEF